MDDITKETTERIMSSILGRRFISEVDAAHALLVANILENYFKLRSKTSMKKTKINRNKNR